MSTGFKTATVASADVPATQTNFPVYIDLSRLGITTQADADSVRVYADSSKTTEWAREIVSATEMHVKVPSLTSTTSIYVYWDGTSADYAVTDTYGRNAVWSGYSAVYHLSNTTDSTGNGFTLTGINSPTLSVGVFGNNNSSYQYGGSNYHISPTNILDCTSSIPNATISTWVKPEITTRGDHLGQWPHHLLKSGMTASRFRAQSNYSTNAIATDTSNYSLNTWYHNVFTLNDSSFLVELFVNGASKITGTGSGTRTYSNQPLALGGEYVSGVSYNRFTGSLDEVRVSLGILSPNWITTEYNNQSDEAGFWGTWSDVGGATNTTNFFLMM